MVMEPAWRRVSSSGQYTWTPALIRRAPASPLPSTEARGTITVVPRDPYGNNVGPGRGDGISITGAPGTTVSGPVRDNGDGSYTVPVTWDPSAGDGPGVIIGQPGRPPVVVNDPKAAGKNRCTKWIVLFWLMVLIALILLVLWIVK